MRRSRLVEDRAPKGSNTDLQLLISLWPYAYSRGISSCASRPRSTNMSRVASGCAGWGRSVMHAVGFPLEFKAGLI